MEHLEQLRAAHALSRFESCRKRPDEGDCLSGYPGLVINNGLLATLAFSLEKGAQHLRVADAIAYHLDRMEVCRRVGGGEASADWLLRHLGSSDCSAQTLRRATDEALAFLGYLKRFAKSSL